MFEGLERITYQAGERIFEFGEEGHCAYLIESGHVEISSASNQDEYKIGVLGPGELFGEIALIDKKPRTATVTTLEETRLVRINRELIEERLNKVDPVIEHLLRLVLKRFRYAHYRFTGQKHFLVQEPELDDDRAFSTTRDNLIKHIKRASDINEALEREEFQLHYQPIVSIRDNRLVGFEALIRWFHPQDGLISPLEFLDIAEETGQIVSIGTWTLESACRDLAALSGVIKNSPSDRSKFFISVNLSPRQLTRSDGAARIADVLDRAGVNPANIKLEITETALITEPEIAHNTLSDLRRKGFYVSLDDFGTGYSSLSYLQKFPVDDIKIDRSFISRMFVEHGSMQIVKASIDLAGAMDLKVVAEGVETMKEVNQLDNLNCTYAQGYYFSKPLPLEEAVAYAGQAQ